MTIHANQSQSEDHKFGGETLDPYENLAQAIILQAVKDYRLTDDKSELQEIERFFRSGWGWYSSRGCCAPPKSKPLNGFPAPKGVPSLPKPPALKFTFTAYPRFLFLHPKQGIHCFFTISS